MNNKYYITNEIAVDPATEVTLLDNGETGAERVSMVRATGIDGATYVYLCTNGDPVVLQDSADAVRDFLADIGCDAQDVIDALRASEQDEGIVWAIDTLVYWRQT